MIADAIARTNGRVIGRHEFAASIVERLNVQAQHIKCDVCGSDATRLEIEIIGTAGPVLGQALADLTLDGKIQLPIDFLSFARLQLK